MKTVLSWILIFLSPASLFSQVGIRLFAGNEARSALFSVVKGNYVLNVYDEDPFTLSEGDAVIFAMIGDRLAVKITDHQSFLCDSLEVNGSASADLFSLRITGRPSPRRVYDGDLRCFPDLGRLILINKCAVDNYIAGVVQAEGGSGRHSEYFRSQALLVRSYLYKYLDRHILDGYNLCDNVHCQAYNGVCTDSLIKRAVRTTHGLVVLDKDRRIISPAFHSNCGGETSISGDVWLEEHSYLKSVTDPWCTSSPNARWTRNITLSEWTDYLRDSGCKCDKTNPSDLSFLQERRLSGYQVGSFTLPFATIRNDLKLRSAFFSVNVSGQNVTLRGRGYGHGVGLCQEGAMVMASKGFNFRQIIDFYFSDVMVTDIGNVKKEINNF